VCILFKQLDFCFVERILTVGQLSIVFAKGLGCHQFIVLFAYFTIEQELSVGLVRVGTHDIGEGIVIGHEIR
jgi:hypothetical protein